MESLNKLEEILLKSILEENIEKYPFLMPHLPLLRVRDREYTGVGMYTNFEYASPIDVDPVNALISSERELVIPSLKNQLSFVIDVTNGKINHLEIVTNGNENWDGKADIFELK